MKRMPFEPPTDHYDKKIVEIDEQLCSLINQRKELSDNNPGFPTRELISKWSNTYSLYEDFLNSIFSGLLHENMYKPTVEPKNFLKNIPVLKSFEKDDVFYSVTFIRQYENASVVNFTIDREFNYEEIPRSLDEHTFFELSIEGDDNYDCRNEGGGGSGGHGSCTFVISPALPEDISKFKLVFTEYELPYKKTGKEFIV